MSRAIPTLLFAAALLSVTAEAGETTLERWLDRELIPHVTRQLSEHPRFKGETVLFVVMKDGTPAAISDTLTLSLRDRLLDAAVDKAGISIGWRQREAPATAAACQKDQVHYYIGVETSRELNGQFAVRVRALDIVQSEWVGGFGRQWSGYLTTPEHRAMRQRDTDALFLGTRDVPFAAGQNDLLASYLAHELACTLHRQLAGDYVIERTTSGDDPGALGGTVELIGNNLVRSRALALTADRQRSNAILSGKAHRIDGDLYQYWVSVTPSDDGDLPGDSKLSNDSNLSDDRNLSGDSKLSAVSASAYVVLERHEPPARTRQDWTPPTAVSTRVQTVAIPGGRMRAVLGPLAIGGPADLAACPGSAYPATGLSNRVSGAGRCSVLRAPAYGNAVVFLLQHQTGHGLVRLGDTGCRSRTTARLVRSGNTLRFPVAFFHDGRSSAVSREAWPVEVRNDVYYAIAVADSELARRLANHIDRLPLRCGVALRPGLQDAALDAWLRQLAAISTGARGAVEWRGLEVEDLT